MTGQLALIAETPKKCAHEGQPRLLDHYDVTCSGCGQIIGRVALTPCAVLTAQEARQALVLLGDDECESRPSTLVSKLRSAAR